MKQLTPADASGSRAVFCVDLATLALFRSVEHPFGPHANDAVVVASKYIGAESDVFNSNLF